ncbi:MAG: NfeD family protein [Pseudomonadota bacterium]
MQILAAIIELFGSTGAWNWIILAVLLLVLETLIPGVYFVWFGSAAMVVGTTVLMLDAFAPSAAEYATWQLQTISFALMAIGSIFAFRRFADTDMAPSDLPNLNVRGQQYVGRRFEVVEEIADGRGKIRVGDTLWAVRGPDTPIGTVVKVTGVQGTVLEVEQQPIG